MNESTRRLRPLGRRELVQVGYPRAGEDRVEGLRDRRKLVRGGLTNAAIADRLYIYVRTVESHVSSLLAKRGNVAH